MNKNKVIKATLWSSLGQFGGQGITFIVGIILARLLDPEQFGLIAMIIVFSGWGQLFINFGFSQAIIQDADTSQKDLSTVFFFNLFMGFVMSSLLFFASYPISNFYNQPELVKLTQFISLIFIFSAFSLIQRTLLIKKINLKFEAVVVVLSSLVSGIIAIYMAYKGLGVWALAVKMVLQSFIESSLFWTLNRWRPNLIFSFTSLKKLLKFASNMFGAGIFHSITYNFDKLIIGKLFSVTQLGFYERASTFSRLIGTNLGTPFGKIILPVLSDLQNDDERFILAYKKMLRMVATYTIPIAWGLIVVAKPLIVFLMTDKWLFSAKLMQILAISACFGPLAVIMVNAIAAKGRADIFFQLDIIKTSTMIASIFVGSLWSITGVVIAMVMAGFVNMYVNMHAVSKLLPLPVAKQLRAMAMPTILSMVMVGLLFLISSLNDWSEISQLVMLSLIGSAFYLTALYMFDRNMFFEIKSLPKQMLAQKI